MIASQITHFLSPSRLSNSTLDTFTMSTSKSLALAFICILLLSFIFILFVCILGAITTRLYNTDLNNVTKQGIYYQSPATPSDVHQPTQYGFIRVIAYESELIQIYTNIYDTGNRQPVSYIRNKMASGWSNWHELAYDIPSFYKDYSTLEALATAVDAPLKGSVLVASSNDLNDFTTPTTRIVSNLVLNSPITGATQKYGVLVVIASSTGGSDCIQYFVTGGYGKDISAFSVRIKSSTAEWTTWKSVALT